MPKQMIRTATDGSLVRSIILTMPSLLSILRAGLRCDNGPRLSVAQYRTLAAIKESVSGATLVAKELGITEGTMSRIVEKLVARGLLLRTRNVSDRRGNVLRLTPNGEVSFQIATEVLESSIEKRLGLVTAQDKMRLCEALATFRAIFEAQTGDTMQDNCGKG